jgi:hypothetical protein
MTDPYFEPPPVPVNSRVLVSTLKRRLIEAIETGKPSDAKTYVDIIDRLARMAWLDDASPAERMEANRVKRAKVMADVDIRLARFLAAERESEAGNSKRL